MEKIFTTKAQSNIEREIVVELFDTTTNLEVKTELNHPIQFATLKSLKDFCEANGLTNSALIIDKFMEYSFKFLISKERKGREEYIRALQSLTNSLNQIKTEEDNKKKSLISGS